MQHSLPDTLPILPLPPNQVLFPQLVISLQLATRHAVALVRSVIKVNSRPVYAPKALTNESQSQDAASSSSTGGASGSSALIIGCAPLKPVDALGMSSDDGFNGVKPAGETTNDSQGDDSVSRDDESTAGKDLKRSRKRKDWRNICRRQAAARGHLRIRHRCPHRFLAVLEGLSRISIDPSSYPSPALSAFYTARITHLPDPAPLSPSHSALLARLRTASTALLDTLESTDPLPPLFDRKLRTLLSRLSPASAATLVDSLVASLPISSTSGITHSDKCAILAVASSIDRVEKGVEILGRANESLKLAKRITERVDKTLNRRQREYVLMQQLLAIKQELDDLSAQDTSSTSRMPVKLGGGTARRTKLPVEKGMRPVVEDEEEDEVAELGKKVNEKAFSDEARIVALRELKRLKKTPQQGAEYGVIRNYLDTLLSLPWTSADATPLPLSRDFIAQARKKLDEDHYGLTKIKKRLLEWLAVLRLQQEQYELEHPAPLAPHAGSLPSPLAPLTDDSSTSTALVPYAPPSSSSPTLPSSARPPPPSSKSPIILLHGPPGVGKTSIARSLAEAMGRKFVRISLGGVRDEAEIRGHRRTYVGAMVGKIVAALRKAGTSNPVILLDEIDKMGHASHHGDPSAAMLEVLDPEQNWCFEDHYLGVPFVFFPPPSPHRETELFHCSRPSSIDLSAVLFIATANSLDTISDPLYDRMEAVELSGYVHDEKLHIARHKLLPKQLSANSLTPSLVSLSDSTLLHLITRYTREAGVRSLERQLGAVCRAKVVEYAEARDKVLESGTSVGVEDVVSKGYKVEVDEAELERILGRPRLEEEETDGELRVGVATGLAYQGSGNGGILHIETTLMPGTGLFHLTGQLGDVISESARLAFAWVRAHAYELGIAPRSDDNVFKNVDVHLHLPAGSIKKDGPSAGVAMVVAMVSLRCGHVHGGLSFCSRGQTVRSIPPTRGLAMTGEITLRGNVTPVGGIKEKVLAAHRAGITKIVLPLKNRQDVEADLPASVKDSVEFVFVRTIEDALEASLPQLNLLDGPRRRARFADSRL
ncbi:SPOSA6832_03523 [Sporobolomyces salmonicolor]|uniref:SPOSA6832_03523-mRNA-1:cds n=1 Tax=Sporidiobolus salmonicolor TaxID=5005 RepID=A0A0D6EPR3_SPOSA|nr:SPOSA6832_03523 [Sporobolomyces salmonicolor]